MTALRWLVVLGLLPLAAGAAGPVLADFGRPDELSRWKLGNSGPQSKVERVPGPDGVQAAQVTCVYEPTLSPQAASPQPYLPFERACDGHSVPAGMTRVTFWHRGAGVNLVFLEPGGGVAWYTHVEAAPQWRREVCPLSEFAYGWGGKGNDGARLDLARIERVHFGLAVPVGGQAHYAVADLRFERNVDDLDPFEFIGDQTPMKLSLWPAAPSVPLNRAQPLLVQVTNADGCGLRGVTVHLALQGAGGLDEPATRELTLTTDEQGLVRATYRPRGQAGERSRLTVDLPGTPAVATAETTLVLAEPVTKPTLGADGFFHRPDGQPLMLLGGLFLPWWFKVTDGQPGAMSPISIIGASEAEQRAWFAYLQRQGVNCIRGYWPVGGPLKFGPNGEEVKHVFCLDGQVNEPIISHLERTMAIGGEYGIGFTLTILDCARPFIAPGGRVPAGTSRRKLAQQVFEYLRVIVPRLRNNPNVWAYELTNEQMWGIFDVSDRLVRGIKDLDPDTPVMISHWGGGLQTADPIPWMQRTHIDVYQPHVYPDKGHSLWGPTVDSGLIQEVHYNAMQGPKPWLLGESGGYNTHPPLGPLHDDTAEAYLARDCIWFALLNRSVGAFLWGHRNPATAQFALAAKIAQTVDWSLLAKARAAVQVAVPRDVTGDGYFRTDAGKQALAVMAQYARWGLDNGVPVDFPLQAAGGEAQVQATDPFSPPKVAHPFQVSPGYQLKVRVSADGKLAVGYLRNIAEIKLHLPETPKGWNWKVTGSHIRVRKPTTAELSWSLPAENYQVEVWDLDTGEHIVHQQAGNGGRWRQTGTEHDFVVVWRAQ